MKLLIVDVLESHLQTAVFPDLCFYFQPPTVPDLDKSPKVGRSLYIWGEGPFSSRWFSLEIVAYAQSKVFDKQTYENHFPRLVFLFSKYNKSRHILDLFMIITENFINTKVE